MTSTKSGQMMLYVTEPEYVRIMQAAAKAGKSRSAFVRDILTEHFKVEAGNEQDTDDRTG